MNRSIKQSWGREEPLKRVQTVYRLNGIVHLPHYVQEGVFVSPADKIGKIESDLIKLGAKPEQMLLWSRLQNDNKR